MRTTRDQIQSVSVPRLVGMSISLAVVFFLLNIVAAYLSQWIPLVYGSVIITHAAFIVIMSLYAMDANLFGADRLLRPDIGLCALLILIISVVFVILFFITTSYVWAIMITWGVISFSFLVPAILLRKNTAISSDKTIFRIWTEKWKQILIQMVPILLILLLIRFPGERCTRECWGFMEGGLITWPWLGIYLFLTSCFAAVIPARIYVNWAFESLPEKEIRDE